VPTIRVVLLVVGTLRFAHATKPEFSLLEKTDFTRRFNPIRPLNPLR
jgi:hypothetical protein